MACDCIEYIIAFVVAIVTFLAINYVYFMWNTDYWSKRGVFCPDSKALLGNVPGQVTGKRNMAYEIEEFYKSYKDKYPYIGIFNLRSPRLLVFDPEIVKDVLVKYFKHFQANEFTDFIDRENDLLFGNHPFFLVGEEWKKKRAEFTPAFSNSRIKAIYPMAEDACTKMLNYIRTEIDKKTHDGFDTKDLTARYMITIVSSSIYGVDSDSFSDNESKILTMSRQFTSPNKSFFIKTMLSTLYPFLGNFLKVSFCREGAADFYIDLMKNALRRRQESDNHPADYLDYLLTLRTKNQMTDIELAGNGASFLVDGFDTTSTVLTAALYELGKNKVVQGRLRNDILEAMPTVGDVNYEKIMDLPYLDQVWNETLRMHPPLLIMSKACNVPIEMELPSNAKLSFKKGDVIYIPVKEFHMDPEYHPEPKKFDPERFSADIGGTKSFRERCVFLPFGEGPRICPGMRFAVAQAKTAIATIVRNYEISLNPKCKESFEMPAHAIINLMEGCRIDLKEYKRSEE